MAVLLNFKNPNPPAAQLDAGGLTEHSTSEEVRAVLRSFAAGADALEAAKICKVVAQRTQLSISDIRSALKEEQAKLQPPSTDFQLALARHVLMAEFAEGAHLRATPDGRLFRFDVTHWNPIPEAVLRRVVQDTLVAAPPGTFGNGMVRATASGATALLKSIATKDHDLVAHELAPAPIINTLSHELWLAADGSVDPRPHRPESGLTGCIRAVYDPSAACPKFDAAMLEICSHSPSPTELGDVDKMILCGFQ